MIASCSIAGEVSATHPQGMSKDLTMEEVKLRFSTAARLDDELEITVHSVETGGVRMTFKQDITRCSDRQQVAAATLTAVCLRADNFKPTRMPRWIRAEIRSS